MQHDLIQFNYATIVVIAFLLIFIRTNHLFDKKIMIKFRIAAMTVLLMVVVDSIEYWTASLPYPTMLRVWMSAIGYSLRPFIIYDIIQLLTRDHLHLKILSIVPLILNMLIAFSALFSGIAFSYSPENEFIRGPLGYTAFVVCGYYMILLVILSVREFHNRNASEAFIVIAIVCITVSSTILEAMGGFEGMINETGAVSITFYYLYFHTQQFKRDALTNALNRRCFYTDAARNFSSLSALVAIDLNNLKVLNDQKGHAEGDLAICTMVDCVQRVLLKNCYLYRTGGDEFMILCFKQSETRVKGMLAAIRTEMSKTSYTCALGMACMEAGKTLEKLCAQADAAMYQDKIEGKKLRNEPLRS